MTISSMRLKPHSSIVSVGPVEVDVSSFPDKASGRSDAPPCTIDNVRHMLDANGISVRYNIIAKRTEIVVPWVSGTADNSEVVSMTHILSLASRYGLPVGLVPAMVEAIADERAYNPAADWMHSRAWDGEDRLPAFYATITPRAGYPLELRDLLMRRWLLSIAAAATMPDGVRFRGVLTLQGPQGIGKTSWGLRLINDPVLGQQLIKVDHHLDPGNKDSLLGAINHLICEIGELESSLRRDISRLKGFLTAGTDKVRRPYARAATVTQRRTVFYATVNATDFLVDDTGNSRWWTIPCECIDHNHDIDMQQVFAQCLTLLEQGEQWWLTADEERMLEQQNSQHRSFSLVRDRLAAVIDMDADPALAKHMTASEVLHAADFSHPTNAQAKEAATFLRSLFGESKRVNGRDKWRVPLRATPDDDQPVVSTKSKFD
ncbi:VapE domain-containing protein [Sphingomonas citri]